MKGNKLLKRIFLLLPVAVWCLTIGLLSFQNSQIDEFMKNPDGMIIESGNNQFTIGVNRTVENEVVTYVITVMDNSGATVLESVISADHDLYGFSFVKAMQVDNDVELEIVAWGNNIREGESFILDFSGNEILLLLSFDEISDEAKDTIENYKRINVEYPALLGLLFIATLVYYFGYYIVTAVIRVLSRNKNPEK